jgi:hypothetical protein
VALFSGSRASAQTYDTNGDFVQTFAGSAFFGYLDGQGTQTMFNGPNAIVADSNSNLFVWDSGNSRIRKITPDGTVSTFVGGGGSATGLGTNVNLNYSSSARMVIDHSNAVWLLAFNGATAYLVRIGSDANVTRPATNLTGLGNGICFDSANNLYYSGGNKIYRWFTNGTLEVFVGSGNFGSIDGTGVFTSFSSPSSLACDAADNIYVWDSGSGRIRRVNQSRDVVTIAGLHSGNFDGSGTNTGLASISAMCVDASGNVIMACGTCIRKMDAQTNVVTMAGSFTQSGYTNDAAGDLARFNNATGVCLSQGMIFVADSGNQRVRNITFNPTSQLISPASLQLNTYPGVQITGTVGRTYQVQSSPDMSTWTTRATILLPSSPYIWIDQNPINGNQFYRALLLP